MLNEKITKRLKDVRVGNYSVKTFYGVENSIITKLTNYSHSTHSTKRDFFFSFIILDDKEIKVIVRERESNMLKAKRFSQFMSTTVDLRKRLLCFQ